ncbi:hypothetical protein MIMGU_mgv1a016904mg [Erythranthe guttata]|uniref:Uncharacterized protein n=1 Tax=Erythranthe guttata TaxID=4155 RepID=A0A022QWP3_ERYGU|nr:hypothetical protein MIMGU_mgv1a016904mg [Erythranthe guttata]
MKSWVINMIQYLTQMMQTQTPRRMRRVPNKARPTRVSSPRMIPKTAVAANVVAFVTGTAKEMGVSIKMPKKVADADRFIRKGKVYCQINTSFNHFLTCPVFV